MRHLSQLYTAATRVILPLPMQRRAFVRFGVSALWLVASMDIFDAATLFKVYTVLRKQKEKEKAPT